MEKVEKFFLFETKNSLFDIVDKHGLRPWDGIRYYVLMSILRSSSPPAFSTDGTLRSGKVWYTIKRIISFLLYFLRHRKCDTFFLLCSRDKKNNVYYDKISNDTYELADKKNCFTIETTDNYRLDNYKYGVDVCPTISNVFSRLYHIHFDFSEIYSLVKDEFPNFSLSIEDLNHYYNRFWGQYKFYSFVFGNSKIRKTFFVQNDIQKGLIAAANEKGVELFEFQHGQISRNHPAYSYPVIDSEYTSLIYHPNYLLTFGEFWSKNRYYPGVSDIVLGNDSYSENAEVPNVNGNGKLLVISNIIEGELLAKRVKEVLNKSNKFIFFFKLHPNQFDEFEHYKKIFEGEERVQVVSNQQTINQLLIECEAILLNDSTVELEALRMGKKVFVLTEQLYEEMDFVLGEEGVYACKDSDEFLEKYEENKDIQLPLRNDFFVPFKQHVARQLLGKE
jgi:hypothetical protein